MAKMTQFVRLAAYKTKDQHRGHRRHLTAKLVCNLIVFAGSQAGQQSISANADIRAINACWKVYCENCEGMTVANLPQIDRAAIDAARGK